MDLFNKNSRRTNCLDLLTVCMLALGPVFNSAGDLGCVEFYPGFSVRSQAIKETFHHALCLKIDTKNYRSELVRLQTRYRDGI